MGSSPPHGASFFMHKKRVHISNELSAFFKLLILV